MKSQNSLPDVARDSEVNIPLDQVGMSGISIPLTLELSDNPRQVVATAAIKANVQNGQKGLHMSRMYQSLLDLSNEPLTVSSIAACTKNALKQQKEVEASALAIKLETVIQLRQPALNSDGWGWNAYPIEIDAQYSQQAGLSLMLGVQITYSSSCPASAALSRRALTQAFEQAFKNTETLQTNEISTWLETNGTLAIPHSQRSTAKVSINIEGPNLPISELIKACEETLGTPVQTYVKRDDEQEFALRNGANPMFVEDASRRLINMLQTQGYSGNVQVTHQESLHGHDAVAQSSFTSGIK